MSDEKLKRSMCLFCYVLDISGYLVKDKLNLQFAEDFVENIYYILIKIL